MPKEITHWLIAQQVAAALKNSALGEITSAFPNCMHLGAIMHDAAFYARKKQWKKQMHCFADALHGRDAQSFAIIQSVTMATEQSRNPGPLRAMLIGMLTHIAADSCFHPLVYHETGNYYDPDPKLRTRAVQLHRQFETTLDIYLAGTIANIKNFSLQHILRGCELRLPHLLQQAFVQAAVDFNCPKLPQALTHCLKVFSRMQALYANPIITHPLEVLHSVLPNGAREVAALFYLPERSRQAPELHGPRTIPDPETGLERTVTILGLYDSAIQLSIKLCRELEPALMGTAPFTAPSHLCNLNIALPSNPQPGA